MFRNMLPPRCTHKAAYGCRSSNSVCCACSRTPPKIRYEYCGPCGAIADASSPATHPAPITWEAFLRRGGIQVATASNSEQPTAAIPAVQLVSGTVSQRGGGESRGGHRGRGGSESRGSPRGRGEWAWRAGQRYRIRGRGGRQQQPRAEPGTGSSAGASGDPPQQQNQPRSGTHLGTVPMQRARPVAAPPDSPPADILAELSLDPINWWDILAAARNPPAPELAQEGAGPWRQPGPAPAARRVLPDPFDIPTPFVSTVPPSDTSLNELAEDASILLELFSQSSHPNNSISDEHRDLITSAAASISAIQGRVGQTATLGNRGTRPRQEMEAGADCIICYAETADTVFLPCKHLVVCATCCEIMGIQERNVEPELERCPVCRTGVAQTIKIFRS